MAVVSLCLVLYVSTQPRPLFLWAFIFNLRFRPFSIRRGRPFALSVFAPSCLCSLNTSGGGVHIVHVVYIRAGCVDAAPLGGAGGCFRAFVFCCTKRGRACEIRPTKGQTLHTGKRTARGRALLLHTAGRLSTLSIFGAVCFSCSCGIASTRRVVVHIVHVVYIRAGCVDAAPAPLSSSFGAFSIRRARAVVLVSYSLNAGRCHIGRRLDAAPPRRAVLRLSGFGLLLHEKANTTKEQRGAASSFPAAGRLSTLSILSIFGACLIISSMFGGCPCCLYLSISGAVQFISRGRGCVEALASCCTKGTGRVICQTKGRTLHPRQKNSTGRPPLLHTSGRFPPAARYAAGLTM